jgi:phosphopantothenoylcysteine decarboxylase/phosphopantothenate--cysteine ligase
MNQVMWEHPATRRNLEILQRDGCQIAGPDSGPQACGEYGPGRMLEPEVLFEVVREALSGTRADDAAAMPRPGSLAGRRVLITAGPTREAIDPVRYISNHSSGKQGYALARAARDAGAEVILVSGPVNLTAPPGVTRIPVTTAIEMQEAVAAHLTGTQIFIGVAAVADYRAATAQPQKIKKTAGEGGMTLTLVQNPDIISGVAQRPDRPFVVGFAAETEQALRHAREKRVRKGMDMIVVNDVSDSTIGFNSDENAVTLIWEGGEEQLPRAGKDPLAAAIINRIAARFSEQSAPANRGSMAK